MNSVMYIFLY